MDVVKECECRLEEKWKIKPKTPKTSDLKYNILFLLYYPFPLVLLQYFKNRKNKGAVHKILEESSSNRMCIYYYA